MSALINIPFNFQPVNSGNVANAGYTVPAGKYSRIMATLSTYARNSTFTISIAGSGQHMPNISSGNDSTSVELYLRSGEVVSVSNTSASGTISVASSASTSSPTGNGSQSIAQLLVGGVIVAQSKSAVSGVLIADVASGLATTFTVTMVGSSDVNYRYEEFNNIS
jgi:hypothetical protein